MRLPPSILAIVVAGCATLPGRQSAPTPDAVNPASVAVVAPLAAPLVAPASAPPTALPAVTPMADLIESAPDSARPVSADAAGPHEISLAGVPAATPGAVSAREVTRQAISVFGDSLASAPVVVTRAADEPTWDMDVRSYETQERVAHYVTMFSGRGKSRITERLAKGTRYEPMIRARFKAGGLPEDMYYLALIESGFDPNAYSRAAAVGMWQFMTSTGRGLGMRIDWWVDERRDPVKSTVAAVRFIRGLRDQFGSLYLAAAAYNGGPGRVARGLAKYSDDLENTQQAEDAFFVLADKDYLRNETREYVPQLIAAALVAKEPVRYGMTLTPLPPFSYDSVRVPGGTPLAAVALASGTTVATIRDLNPHFLRGMTPPGDRMQVRIPIGASASFTEALSALPKADRIGTHVVVSRKGETVERIADAHGISAAAVETFNSHLRHLKPSGRLVAGQAVVIPSAAVVAASLHVPDPSIEKYGSSSSKRLRTHTVRHGETVRLIARKYHTTPERIMRLNGLRKPMIFAGQDLIVAGTPRNRKGHRSASASSRSPATRHGHATQSGAGSKAGAR